MCDSCGAQHPLSLSSNAFDVPLGQKSLYTFTATTAGNEKTHENTQSGVSDRKSVHY